MTFAHQLTMHYRQTVLLLGFLTLAGCSDSSDGHPGSGADASDASAPEVDATTKTDTGPDGFEAPTDADASLDTGIDVDADAGSSIDAPADTRRDGPDANCPNPVMHLQACASEGSQVCGYRRSCTDVLNQDITTCTCTAGQYHCGTCPSCTVDQAAPGCGIGQVCDQLILHRCDGTTETIDASCTCSLLPSRLWTCDNGRIIEKCSDAGADAAPDAATVDAPSGG